MDNTSRIELKEDLTEELAIVRALIAKNGQPVLTEEVIKGAGSQEPVFVVGDVVHVLRACRLPIEDVLGVGVIDRITESVGGARVFWVSGFLVGRDAAVLRHV